MRTLVVGLACLVAGAASAEEAVYRMRGPTVPVARQVNGYRLDVRDLGDGEVAVRVVTSLGPIGSSGSYGGLEGPRRPQVPVDFELPSRLASSLRPELEAWQAATTVLEWVTDHIVLIEDDDGPQDAESVLTRHGGRCSGLANATAALLMAAGFDARTVSGLLISDHGVLRHRWVECRLPGAGWVPTDPTLGWWIITPRHVAFDDTVERLPEVMVDQRDTGDLHRLPRIGTVLVRPNDGAELICRLSDAIEGRTVVAQLRQGSDLRRGVLGPEARFSSLLPGRWVLTVELDGRVVEQRAFTLRSGAVHSYVVHLPSAVFQEVGS
ncbi:MAG: transglutaminase-like domain-containing protein [Holophagae bacterium]